MKFAKLYDGFDFNDEKQISQYFDHFIKLEFMRFSERKPILEETFNTLVEAYNNTPPNFVSPPDHIIEKVVRQVDRQIEVD